ncbi:MAG: hypothetical protein Kow0069_12770 [Promethearchaeota archaeon]
MEIKPRHERLVVFSGGGGLVVRSQTVEVPAGRTTIEIVDVPASFDPSTTSVDLLDVEGAVALVQVDVRRPDKRIMDAFIQREKTASDVIIRSSTDLRGDNRERIISICESAYYRRYEDMEGFVAVTVDAKVPSRFKLRLRYFLEDSRLKWRPSVHVRVDKATKKATVEFHAQIMNNTAFAYEDVEVQLAEFELEREVGEEGYLAAIEAEQAVQTKMARPNMLRRLKRVRALLK